MNEARNRFFSVRVSPWSLLMAVGVLLCAATVFGFLGRLSWLLDLFSHFRVQYLLGLAALAGLLFVGRRPRTAAVFLGFASVNLLVVAPLYFNKPSVPAGAAPRWRAMLLNVNTRRGDPLRVGAAISRADPDILVLEEISSRWMSDLAWLTEAYPSSCVRPREDNFGIGLFSKLPLTDSEVVDIGAARVPSILATLRAGQADLRVVATHPLPPGGPRFSRLRNEQLEGLPAVLGAPRTLLLLGDLNVTPWNDHFQRLLSRTGLRDSAQGYGVQPTWPNYHPVIRIPLDHCLHSRDIMIVDRTIGEDVSSDHLPLIVDFVIGGGL